MEKTLGLSKIMLILVAQFKLFENDDKAHLLLQKLLTEQNLSALLLDHFFHQCSAIHFSYSLMLKVLD